MFLLSLVRYLPVRPLRAHLPRVRLVAAQVARAPLVLRVAAQAVRVVHQAP